MSINYDSTQNNEPTKTVSHSNSMRLLTFLSAIGGFLFGYDTGVVSGAMLLIREEMSLSTEWHEAIVSVTVGAAWLSSLGAGFIADRVGRKSVILGASLVFTAGSVVLGAAQGKEMLLVGRIIVGVAIGLASMSVPVYISENAVPAVRGRLVTTNSLFITGGQFSAALLCGAFSTVPDGWRYMLGLAAIPAGVQFVGFLWMPESTRWLISQKRYDEAVQVLKSIRDADAPVAEEFEAIKASCLRDGEEARTSSLLTMVVRSPCTRHALVLGCVLQAFQQLAGINTVMYYSGSIIQMAGVNDLSLVIWLACTTAGVNFFCTFIGYHLVERVGRRTLTLVSLTGVVLSLMTLGVAFQIMSSGSPQVSVHGSGICGLQRSCTECVDYLGEERCGFCYVDSPSGVSNGSCESLSVRGRCANTSDAGLTWADGWCPSQFSFLAVAALGLYLLFFAPGMGTMPWTINSEIYPTWARSFCTSLATSTNYLCNLLVSMTFLTLTEVLTKQGAFYLYAGFATAGLLILLRILPETKGKTLEEVEQLFSGSLCSQFRSGDDKRIRDKKSDETTDL